MSDQLQDYRRIVLDCDFVNDWVPPIIASTGDLNGRMIVAKVTNNGSVVTPSEKLHAQLLVNPKPNDEGYFGDYVSMEPVSGYETAAFSCSIPYGAVSKPGRTRMGVAFLADNDDGTQDIICTRPFNVEVEQGVLRVDSDSAIGEFEENVKKAQAAAEAAKQSETKAAASETNAKASEASAKKSETNAASSATQAGQSAKNASQSASAAAQSSSQAATSASQAAASASAAKQSETNAAASASEAAESASQARDLVENFNLTVGETTTSEPGTNAVVEITKQGTVYTADFTIPRGEQGPRGENTAAISSVTGSVDNNVGTPSVDVVAGGTPEQRTLDFQFHNLKGKHDGAQVWTGWEDPTVKHPDDVAEGDLWLKSQRYWTRSEGDHDNSPSLLADFYTFSQGEKDNSPSVLVTLDSVVMELLIRHNGLWSPMIWQVNTSLTPGATTSDQEPSKNMQTEVKLLELDTRVQNLESKQR